MAKLNVDALRKGMGRQFNNQQSIYGNKGNDNSTIKVGSGLMEAMNMKSAEMEEIQVTHDQIHTTDKNDWSMKEEEIKELAELIRDVGILNHPILKKVGDKDYEIVAGERRYRAMGYLIQEGIWSSDRKIKVHIFNPNLITLPLTDEEKEDYVRLAENSGQRNKTDGDLLLQMRGYQSIYTSLREKGELTGIKTRMLLAADMKISPSKVAQLQKVENRGSEALVQALLDDQVTVSTAQKIADMPEKEQEEFITEVSTKKEPGEKIERIDILKFQNEKDSKALTGKPTVEENSENTEEEEKPEGILISGKKFRKDINVIMKKLKEKDIYLQEEDYEIYLRSIEKLKKILE